MTRVSLGIGVLGIVLLTSSPAPAQAPAGGGQQADPSLTNLQVFPKETTRAALIQNMYAMNESLGIQCNYCHVLEGPGGRNDYASDEKRPKNIARQMIRFRDDINARLPTILGKTDGARVLCSTCHRGVPIPKQLYEIVFDATAKGGSPSAGIAKYRELRLQFYGGQSYDFSETAFLEMARRAAARPDEAMAYLQANLEFYPRSAITYRAMAQAKNVKDDKAGAIKDLEKAAELDPNNAEVKGDLRLLKGQ